MNDLSPRCLICVPKGTAVFRNQNLHVFGGESEEKCLCGIRACGYGLVNGTKVPLCDQALREIGG